MNAVKEVLESESSRKTVAYWTREDGYRVKIVTSHDKQIKAYRTTLSECVAENRDGYTMEYHRVFANLYKTLNLEPVTRFNFVKLQAIHAEIVAAMVGDVESLLSSHAPIEKEVA